MINLFKKELKSYFVSPIAWVVMSVFLLISGYFFTVILLSTNLPELKITFHNMGITFLFLSPLFTMRLLAEEKKLGTEELLFTLPLTDAQIVLSKYLASLTVFLILLGITWVYPLFLLSWGKPDMGPIFTGYLGLFLMGASFLAVGLFSSSLTENQIIAAVVGFGILLLFWIIGWAGYSLGGKWRTILNSLSLIEHFEDFRKGLIDTFHIVYYGLFIFTFLFLTWQMLARRRG